MAITQAFACLCVADLANAYDWYRRLFGTEADASPMPTLYEWHFGDGALQLVNDTSRAGNSSLTLVVDDLEDTRADIKARGLSVGSVLIGDFARFAQLNDPEGNLITLAQPRRKVQRAGSVE